MISSAGSRGVRRRRCCQRAAPQPAVVHEPGCEPERQIARRGEEIADLRPDRRARQRPQQHDAAVPAPPFGSKRRHSQSPPPRPALPASPMPECGCTPAQKTRVHGSSSFLFRVDGDSCPAEGEVIPKGATLSPLRRTAPPSHRPSSLSCAGVAHGLFYEKSILCSFLQNCTCFRFAALTLRVQGSQRDAAEGERKQRKEGAVQEMMRKMKEDAN